MMEYKLCEDNLICCDSDCRRCANLVHGSLTNENKRLKAELKKIGEMCATLEKENDELRMMNDELRAMNSDLLYRNRLLMETTGPAIFQHTYDYGELNDKIESLKEDIIRLDKCLSNRQCVQLERIKEE